MTIKLPGIIKKYVDASNEHDVKSSLLASQTMRSSVTNGRNFTEKTASKAGL